jgi:hypothetical protein
MIPKSIFTAATSKNGFLTLERTPCFGSCPSYKVTIAQDGTVTYEGRNFVKTKGTVTAQIRSEKFQQLVDEFEKIKYFSLRDRYTESADGCTSFITDLPNANTSLSLNGRVKSISHNFGCRGPEILSGLVALEHKIDEIAGTEKWIK